MIRVTYARFAVRRFRAASEIIDGKKVIEMQKLINQIKIDDD